MQVPIICIFSFIVASDDHADGTDRLISDLKKELRQVILSIEHLDNIESQVIVKCTMSNIPQNLVNWKKQFQKQIVGVNH